MDINYQAEIINFCMVNNIKLEDFKKVMNFLESLKAKKGI